MMTVSIKGGEMYKVVDLFDVWGNEEDGWEVNDSCDTGKVIFFSDDSTDETVFNALSDLELLGERAVLNETVFISNTGDGWEVEADNGLPLYSIVPCGPCY